MSRREVPVRFSAQLKGKLGKWRLRTGHFPVAITDALDAIGERHEIQMLTRCGRTKH